MLKGKFGEIFKKGFMIFGGLAFLWMSGSRIFEMMLNPSSSVENQTQNQVKSPDEKLKQAVKGYEIVLEKEPNNRFALEELVKIYIELKDFEKSLSLIEKLLEIDPNNRFALEKSVETYLWLKQPEKALPPMEKLVELEPRNGLYEEVLEKIKLALTQPENSENSENSPPSSPQN